MNFEIGFSVLLGLFNFKYPSLLLKNFQYGIRSPDVSLKPFVSINVEVNQALQTANYQIEPFDINYIPPFFFGIFRQENLLDIFK